MRMVKLKNTRTGSEFEETESSYKMRLNNKALSEGIQFIGYIDPDTGEVDRTTAIDHIEQSKTIKLNNDESTGEKQPESENQENTESEKGGEKISNSGTEDNKENKRTVTLKKK